MRILLCLLFVFTISKITAQSIDWQQVIASYEEKYDVEVSPKWLFPVVFENSLSQRDTVFIGYHESSSSFIHLPSDSIFGSKYIPLDSSRFQVFFNNESINNENHILKSVIYPEPKYLVLDFIFYNGNLPVKIFFNTSLFSNQNLPEYNENTPQLQGEIWEHSGSFQFGGWNPILSQWEICPFNNPIIITDSIVSNAGCAFKDSLLLEEISPLIQEADVLQIFLKEWAGQYVNISSFEIGKLNLFPNPSKGEFNVGLKKEGAGTWKLIDLNGRIMKDGKFENTSNISVKLDSNYRGVMFIVIDQNEIIYLEKVVIN